MLLAIVFEVFLYLHFFIFCVLLAVSKLQLVSRTRIKLKAITGNFPHQHCLKGFQDMVHFIFE